MRHLKKRRKKHSRSLRSRKSERDGVRLLISRRLMR